MFYFAIAFGAAGFSQSTVFKIGAHRLDLISIAVDSIFFLQLENIVNKASEKEKK